MQPAEAAVATVAQTLAGMPGLRNVLAHHYASIDYGAASRPPWPTSSATGRSSPRSPGWR